jgi:hypothetical protein
MIVKDTFLAWAQGFISTGAGSRWSLIAISSVVFGFTFPIINMTRIDAIKLMKYP